jgi:hypothetical protein
LKFSNNITVFDKTLCYHKKRYQAFYGAVLDITCDTKEGGKLNNMTTKRIVAFLLLVLLIVMCGCSVNVKNSSDSGANSEFTKDDWLLKVDQTIPIKDGDVTVNYTLVLIAQKTGGTDIYGTYEGAAYIGSELDASVLSKAFINVTGGFDINIFANNLSFEVEPYNMSEYSTYGNSEGGASVAPIVKYESMALMSPEMKGGIILDTKTQAIDGSQAGYSDSAGGTAPVVMKLAIKSDKVYVDIPMLKIDRSFEGVVTNNPQKYQKEYLQAEEKIEELIEKNESKDDPPDEEDEEEKGDSEGLAGIMGTIGSNLALPESFPSDEFPLLPDANIINVYESEDKKNIRVMFGTNESQEDILEFYKESIIEKPDVRRIDLDTGGVMFLGQSEQYSNIQLLVMEDLSTIYSSMVSLEVMKK